MSNQAALAIFAIWMAVALSGFAISSQLNLALVSLCAILATFAVTWRDEQP